MWCNAVGVSLFSERLAYRRERVRSGKRRKTLLFRIETRKEIILLHYPILFVHGMGFRDRKIINYWGRIPKVFIEDGNQVFYGGQDSNGTIEDNALFLKSRIEQIIRETGAEKINVIAHSKGGMDMRYAICQLGMNPYVASLTTINTPHNGSKTIDKLLKMPKALVRLAGFCSDCCLRLQGDKHPNAYKVFLSFSTEYARRFNEENPDDPNIYYQSYACVMKNSASDGFLWLTHAVVHFVEGENDGLLTPESVKHGHFQGIVRSNSRRGISHCDEVDMRRHRFTKKQGEGVSDILELYRDILNTLKENGL